MIGCYVRDAQLLCAVVVFATVFGCSKTEDSDVVVSVCGRNLTSAEIDQRASNIALLFAHKTGKTNVIEKVKATFVAGYTSRWVESVVLSAAAHEAGIEPDETALGKCRDQAFQNFRNKGDRAYDDLMAIPGFDRALWEDQVRSEALVPLMKDYWAKKFPIKLPATYADDMIKKILAQNASWSISNRFQYAKATNVWEKLKSGADFVKTAKAMTELKNELDDDGEWAVIDERSMPDEPMLFAWLKRAKPGEFSPPIPSDNGVVIVRLDRLEEQDGYAVSRIFFHLAKILPPASKEEILEVAERKQNEKAYVERLAALVSQASPVYGVSKKQK